VEIFFSCPSTFFWLYKYNWSFWWALSWWSVQFGQFLVCCSSTLGAPCPAICKSGKGSRAPVPYGVGATGYMVGGVVRKLVFGRRTVCNLRLQTVRLRPIFGWQMIASWLNCPLWVSQLGHLSLPPFRGQQMTPRGLVTWITEAETTMSLTAYGIYCVWLHGRRVQSPWVRAWAALFYPTMHCVNRSKYIDKITNSTKLVCYKT